MMRLTIRRAEGTAAIRGQTMHAWNIKTIHEKSEHGRFTGLQTQSISPL